MLKFLHVRLLWRSFNWLARLIIVASAVVAVPMALAVIVLRYWILPDIGQYHDKITASLAGAIGSPVTIGKIEGDWHGLQPHLNLIDVRILDEQRQPALVLPRIDGNVSWMSLFTAELRLANLEIDRPELLVRRDAQGRFFIGGVAVSKQDGDNKFADWLLRQSRMVVRNALIVWVDEQRDAPPLVLQQVNLRIESRLSWHRFALRALPPDEMATPLDVRGDFHGASFDDLSEWRGQIYTQLDYTDVTAWRPWLDLPGEFSRGRGALRGWLAVEGGKVTGVTADVALYDVATKLAEDVPEMLVLSLRGRAAWQDVPGGFEVSTRRLAMRLQNGVEFQPTDFYFRTVNGSDEQPADSEMRANLLQLESLSGLAKFLPLDAGLHARLDAYAPRGKVFDLNAQWRGTPEKPDSYKLKGYFDSLAVNQVGKMPGFSGLTVDVDGNEASGRLSINARQLIVDAPGVLREPLSFSTLTGQAGWRRVGGELAINVDNVAVINDDLAGNFYGSYQTRAGTLGELDLTGRLTRGDIRRAARYTPLVALHKEGNDWLNGALLAGHSEDFSIRIKGNLSDFPLDGTKDVLFKIGGHARDVVMEFDKQWPRIENISGEFLLQGNKLEVKSPSAIMAGSRLQNVTVTIPNVQSKDLVLEIKGEAVAASNVFLQFIQHSPVRGYIDGFTDGMSASGNARLDLSLRVPLPAPGVTGVSVSGAGEAAAKADASAADVEQSGRNRERLQVLGSVRVQDNDINLGKGVPLLRNTRGLLSFTESGMKASGVMAEMLGGPVSIDVQSAGGGVMHASVRGRSNMDVLRDSDPHPLLNYLQGSAAWEADVNVAKKSARVVITSDLQGLGSSLPQPFTKAATEKMPIRVESNSVSEGRDVITAQLGKLLSARLARQEERSEMVIKRGTIVFGNQDNSGAEEKSLESKRVRELSRGKDGVWLVGALPVLSVQGWEGLAGDAGKPGPALPIVGANLLVEKLTGYGRTIKGVRINAAKRGEGWAAQLSGSMLNGEVVWQPHAASPFATPGGSGQGYDKNGKVSVQLRNLQWMKDEQPEPPAPSDESEKLIPPDQAVQTSQTPPRDGGAGGAAGQLLPQSAGFASNVSQLHPGKLPAVEIAIENLQLKGRQIGRFELVGHPDGQDWRMRRLRITNPDGTLMSDGIWHGNAQSQVNLVLDISDAGKILERSSYPNTVKGGSGRLAANLSWAGSPDEFNYATLNGSLKLDTGKGRFLKMDPGVGKLLSILSLQALPKRISLDFTDVFSEGFQFDNIIGNALVKNGVLDTQDFYIVGSSAKVTMKGSVDMNNETQNLRVKVSPTLGDTVSLIGVFAINPVVGIGAMIANEVLGNPLDKLVSFEYNVTGTWIDPSVVKVERAPARPTVNN